MKVRNPSVPVVYNGIIVGKFRFTWRPGINWITYWCKERTQYDPTDIDKYVTPYVSYRGKFTKAYFSDQYGFNCLVVE